MIGAVPTRVVAIAAYDGVQPLDVVGPHEVFTTANLVAADLGRNNPRYEVHVCALDDADGPPGGPVLVPIVSEHGLVLGATQRLDDLDGIDTLIVPGDNGVREAAANPTAIDGIARAAGRSRRVASVCSGAFLAAAAGVFEPGDRVTTHWARAGQLARAHPELVVDPEPIFIGNDAAARWSSAGVTAGIDLSLALVHADLGGAVAQIVARWLVVFLRRPGGQSQFAAPVWTGAAEQAPVQAAIDLIHRDPSGDLALSNLARHAGVSERHLQRLFQAEIGLSPARYVERLRVDVARHLLESDASGLSSIARRCGFGSVETMRKSFVRRVGVSPDQYRRRFSLLDAG